MLNSVVGWLPKAIVAIILVVIGSAIAKVVKDLITAAIGGLSYGRFLANLASIAIIALFAIAALSQIGIAAAVTQPILITVLATIGAILAIGIGGGLVRPMQSRWERMLTAAEDETSRHVAAYQQGRQAAMSVPAGAGAAGAGAAGTGAGSAAGTGAAGGSVGAGSAGSPGGSVGTEASSAAMGATSAATDTAAGPATQQMPTPPQEPGRPG